MLRDSLAADGSNAMSYRTLGALYRQLGMTAEEMQVYADWSAARPGDPLAHYYLANAYLRTGADAAVLGELDQFRALSADHPGSYAMAASIYRRLGLPGEEGAMLATWVEQAPQSFDARQALAQYYQRSGQHDAALAEYQAAVSLIPDNVQARANLASAYSRLGLYADAQSEYAAALALRPADPGLHFQMAEMYRRANDLPAALASYQQVIDLRPESPQAQRAARMMTRIERQLSTAAAPKLLR
jgi:tetratricopeptide (TPR) repeat protein